MPTSVPKSPRPRPAPALGSFVPRRPLAAPRLPAAEPALPDAGDAVARAERFGHHFDRLTVAEGGPPSHGQRGPGAYLAASVIQRKPGLKVGFASKKKEFDLSIAGRPKSFAKKVDRTLSTEESEKPYYDDSGTLKEGFVRGHIVEWNTKRRALESRLKGMDKASLIKSLGLPSGAQDRQVQRALLAHVKGEYSNPANLAITDASDHDEGGEANTLAQRAEKGDKTELRKLYSAAFNPGLSGKGFTRGKIAEHNADFRDAWGVDPEEQGWAKDLEAKRPRRAEPEKKKSESNGEKEADQEVEARETTSLEVGKKRKRKGSISADEQEKVDAATNEESTSLGQAESTTTPAADKGKAKKQQKRKRQKLAHQLRRQQEQPVEVPTGNADEPADEEKREEPVEEKEKTSERKKRKRSPSPSPVGQEEGQPDETVTPVAKQESASQKRNRRRRLKKKIARQAATIQR